MSYTVSVRDLRNHTADVIRRVEEGETAVLTANGRPVAEIRPVLRRPRSFSLPDAWAELLAHRADPGAARAIAEAVPGTTDEVVGKLDRVTR